MRIHRYLAPTAAPVSWGDFVHGCLGLIVGRRFLTKREAELKQYFGVKHVFLLASGKTALATTVRALSAVSPRRKVVIPAYTCFTVPSAVIRGGGYVALCDVNPHTLDFDFAELERVVDRETLCIIVPHLLGHCANVRRVRDMATALGVAVVEDAAQAMGVKEGNRFLGTQGDVGVFSLGRGKNLSAGSGGILLTNSDQIASAVATVIQEIPDPPLLQQVFNLMMMVAMKVLIHPRLYWLPAGLPFLRLGETHFDLDFPMQRLDGVRAGLLRAWQQRLMRSNVERANKGQAYKMALLPEIKTLVAGQVQASTLLRFPLLLPKGEHKSALCRQSKQDGMGVSGLYPSAIAAIPQLQSAFEGRRFPGAETLAERLITLPVHQYVEPQDIQAICRAVSNVIHREMPPSQSHERAVQSEGHGGHQVLL